MGHKASVGDSHPDFVYTVLERLIFLTYFDILLIMILSNMYDTAGIFNQVQPDRVSNAYAYAWLLLHFGVNANLVYPVRVIGSLSSCTFFVLYKVVHHYLENICPEFKSSCFK